MLLCVRCMGFWWTHRNTSEILVLHLTWRQNLPRDWSSSLLQAKENLQKVTLQVHVGKFATGRDREEWSKFKHTKMMFTVCIILMQHPFAFVIQTALGELEEDFCKELNCSFKRQKNYVWMIKSIEMTEISYLFIFHILETCITRAQI